MPRPYRSMQDNLISQPVRVRLSPENWMRVKTLAGMGGICDNDFISLAVEFALAHVKAKPQKNQLMEYYFGMADAEDQLDVPAADEPAQEPEEGEDVS